MIGPYRWLFIIVRARPRLFIYLRNFVLCIVGCVPRQKLLWVEHRGQDRFPFSIPHFLPCSIALYQHVTCAAAAVLLAFNGSTALSVETSVCGAGHIGFSESTSSHAEQNGAQSLLPRYFWLNRCYPNAVMRAPRFPVSPHTCHRRRPPRTKTLGATGNQPLVYWHQRIKVSAQDPGPMTEVPRRHADTLNQPVAKRA